MWDLPFRTNEKNHFPVSKLRDRSDNDKMPIIDPIEVNYLRRLYQGHAPEPYILRNLLTKAGFKYSYDRYDSLLFLASTFIIYDSSALGFYWPKYGLTGPFSKHHSAYRLFNANKTSPPKSVFRWSEITFPDWLQYYALLSGLS